MDLTPFLTPPPGWGNARPFSWDYQRDRVYIERTIPGTRWAHVPSKSGTHTHYIGMCDTQPGVWCLFAMLIPRAPFVIPCAPFVSNNEYSFTREQWSSRTCAIKGIEALPMMQLKDSEATFMCGDGPHVRFGCESADGVERVVMSLFY